MSAWQSLVNLVAKHSDVPRPLRLAEVLDTAEWAASGPSFVQVMVAGASRRAVYRDGPEPAIGAAVQVVLMGADASAPYLALPLPQPTGCGIVYVSGYSLAGGSWRVFRCDTGLGYVWQDRSAHPLGGASFPRRPLRRIGTRLFTWGSNLDYSNPGTLYYSDDNAATWTSAGVAIVNMTENASNQGYLYAVSPTTLYSSGNNGASWSADSGPGGTLRDVAVPEQFADLCIAVYTTAGQYFGTTSEGVSFDWIGPYTPASGASGYADEPGSYTGNYFDGAAITSAGASAPPGAGTFLESLAGVFIAGAGNEYTFMRAGAGHGAYRPATSHPNALTGILVAGFAFIRTDDFSAFCDVVGLDDTTEGAGRTRYVISPVGLGEWAVMDARQVADLGAAFVPSADGLSP